MIEAGGTKVRIKDTVPWPMELEADKVMVETPIEVGVPEIRPVAVLTEPVVSLESASIPLAVFPKQAVQLESAAVPTAVLNSPVVRLKRAFVPSAVLAPG